MTSFTYDIKDFHTKFGLENLDPEPKLLEDDLFNFRKDFLLEELDELVVAHMAGNLEGAADALVDLVYVALGTAYLMGIPFEACWQEVHWANMRKERAESAEDSKRGSEFDVVKPDGWEPPDLRPLLGLEPK